MSETGAHGIPGLHEWVIRVPTHAAATATEKIALWRCTLGAVSLKYAYHVPDTAVTGVDTNTTHLNLLDAGTAGTGTTEIAHIDYIDTGAIDTAELFARAFLTTTGTTFVAYTLAVNATLALQYEKVSTGLLIPPGLIIVGFQPM